MVTSFFGTHIRINRIDNAIASSIIYYQNNGIRAFREHGTNNFVPRHPNSYNRVSFILDMALFLHLHNFTIEKRFFAYLYEIIFGEKWSVNTYMSMAAQICKFDRRCLNIIASGWDGHWIGPVLQNRHHTNPVWTDVTDHTNNDALNTSDEAQCYLHGLQLDYSITIIGAINAAGAPIAIRYILVIEQKNIYQRFKDSDYHNRNSCILFGLGGSPRVAQRAWLHLLSTQLNVPVFGLADEGPHGASLLHTLEFSASAPESENEFRVPIRIIDHDFANNPAFNVNGAFQGAPYGTRDWQIIQGLNANNSTFKNNARVPSGRDALSHRMTTVGTKYQLQHVDLSKLIRRTQVACYQRQGV